MNLREFIQSEILNALSEDYDLDQAFNDAEPVEEGVMSELDILAKEAKDLKSFVKTVFKEFGNLPKNNETLKWLEGIYKDSTNESVNEETHIPDETIFKMRNGEFVHIDDRFGDKYYVTIYGSKGYDYGKEKELSLKYIKNKIKSGEWKEVKESVNENLTVGGKPSQEEVDKFFEETFQETHYLASKPVEEWDEYDMSNWKAKLKKKKQGKPQFSENITEKIAKKLAKELKNK